MDEGKKTKLEFTQGLISVLQDLREGPMSAGAFKQTQLLLDKGKLKEDLLKSNERYKKLSEKDYNADHLEDIEEDEIDDRLRHTILDLIKTISKRLKKNG